jgi:hypothetical protein
LAALRELYEYQAENSVRAAELTVESPMPWGISSWRASGPKRPLRSKHSRMNDGKTSAQAAQTLDSLRSQETYEDLEKLRKARAPVSDD